MPYRKNAALLHALAILAFAGVGFLVGYAFQRVTDSSVSSPWIMALIGALAYGLAVARAAKVKGGARVEPRRRVLLGLGAGVLGIAAFVLVVNRSEFVALISLALALVGLVVAAVAARR